MPYVSDRQRRYFHTDAAREQGITRETVGRWDDESRGLKLPERAPLRDPQGRRYTRLRRKK